MIKRLRAIHDKVGASAFFRIRHLLGKERREFFVGHAGPLEGTAALHLRRRRDHDHRIAAALRAGLKQQRNIEHDHRCTAGLRFGQEFFPRGADQRMHESFEPGKRGVFTKHHRRELGAVDLAATGGARKGLLDERHRLSFIERVHNGVGIVHRYAFFGKEARGSRFAHAKRTGETENEGPFAAHGMRHP